MSNESFADGTVLTDLFGNHPKTKILSVLLSESHDLNATRIAKMGGISRSTVYRHIHDLHEIGVIEQSRKVGNSPLYRINKDNSVAKELGKLEWELLDEIEVGEE